MSNKVTNIYIDTTGFCDEAIERVNKALHTIVKHNGLDDLLPHKVEPCKDHSVTYFGDDGIWFYTPQNSPELDGKTPVGIWELESIALRCQQEKKEDELPTRNIYIDARKLNAEQRKLAFMAMKKIASGTAVGWLPNSLAQGKHSDWQLISADIFEIDEDGDRGYYETIDDMLGFYEDYETLPLKELSFDQIMSLAC